MQDPEQPDVTIEGALFAALERTKLVRCSLPQTKNADDANHANDPSNATIHSMRRMHKLQPI
jgi:hypothetical protein